MNAERFEELAKAARDAEDRSKEARKALGKAEAAAREARVAKDKALNEFNEFVARAPGIKDDEFMRWPSLGPSKSTAVPLQPA